MAGRAARPLLLVALALARTAAAESSLVASDEMACWPSAPLRLVLPAVANPRCAVSFEAEGADVEAILAVDLAAPLAALRRALTRAR